MKNKFIFQIIFSVAFFALVLKIFLSETQTVQSLESAFSRSSIVLLFLLVALNVSVSYLFFIIIQKISLRKFNFIAIINTFLQGGIVNQLIPGSGLIYKYFKFNSEQKISIAHYSTAQTIFYVERILAYIILAVFFGFLTISLNTNLIFLITLIFTFILIIIYKKRKNIYSLTKTVIKKNDKLKNLINDFSKVNLSIRENYLFFFLIFFLFLLQAILECLIFTQIFEIYNYSINFNISSFLWITTSLVTILSFINFFGFFEIVFAYSSTLFDEKFIDIVIIVFTYRILNLISQIVVIVSNTILLKFKK
tara:strand:+ start:82 stop:1005 length:924 start_codon:yes stop_codon:yes gene_type:complete